VKTYYKFLDLHRKKIVSRSGNVTWRINEWQEVKGKIRCCHNGLHCSDKIYQAFSYVSGTVLAKVEVAGKKDKDAENDKHCHQKMRIVQAWEWDKITSVKLAVYAAELVIDIYEKQYPNDKRPRNAIEAAKKYLKKPTKANAYAADAAANAAYAAANAAYATYNAYAASNATANATANATIYAADAAYAAANAAYAAYAATNAATNATNAATHAAAYAATYATDATDATYAANDALTKKINAYMLKLAKDLKELR